MTTVFISDLHISHSTPVINKLFCRFLIDCINKIDKLYILGDFFDVWIGDDGIDETAQMIIDALHQASSLPIFIMHGNRDFLIGRRFLQSTKTTLLPDETIINLYGEKVLLMHGDTLCTKDKAYLKFRRKARCWLLQKLFLLKSLKTRQQIAQDYRNKSQTHNAQKDESIMDVTQTAVEKVMQKYNIKKLIHGHTHRPAIHKDLLANHNAERIVLHAWHNEGGALIWREDGSHELVTFNNENYVSPF